MNWQGRKVLVTGADGFIGSHLVERLASEGARVRAFVFYNSLGTHGWLDQSAPSVLDSVEVVPGDVRDARQVAEAVRDCEVVFHLAALISVPYSYQAPESFVETNVRGTLNVLQAAVSNGNAKVIQTSSSEVYGSPTEIPISESHPLKAQSPYAASKIAADKLAESFYYSFGLPTVVLRPFNTYGPRQSARAVLPTILTQLLAGKSKLSLGALWPERDLTYVEDTVDGFLRSAGVDDAVGSTIQLGTGRSVSVADLAAMAMKVLGVSAEIVSTEDRTRPPASEVDRLVADATMAETRLHWAPKVRLEDGIARTAEWLSTNLDRYRTEEYVI